MRADTKRGGVRSGDAYAVFNQRCAQDPTSIGAPDSPWKQCFYGSQILLRWLQKAYANRRPPIMSHARSQSVSRQGLLPRPLSRYGRTTEENFPPGVPRRLHVAAVTSLNAVMASQTHKN